MTTRITAWKARDGGLHDSEESARRSDAIAELRKLGIASLGAYEIEALLDNAEVVHAALTAYLVRQQKRVNSM